MGVFILALSLALSARAEEVTATETNPAPVAAATTTTAPVVVANAAAATTATAEEATPLKTDNRRESEIALNLDNAKKASSNESPFFRILFSIALMGVLGVGAFVFLRKYATPRGMKTQTQIKVLQQHYLGPKKSLAIIRVAGESILVGITDQNINMIKSLSLLDDEVPEEAPAHFTNVMGSYGAVSAKLEAHDEEEGEDFSFGGIKDIVAKRLKGMRNLE
jgi:flagellar protein FliO/FliZ